mgnify:FL=1
MAGGRKVDHERRTLEVVQTRREKVAYNINYYGRTEVLTAVDSDPVWQIWRVTSVSGIETTEWASFGKYNLKWSDRSTYFGADPAPESDPGVAVYPSGLTIQGKVTEVTLSAGSWTALPPTPMVGRNAICIQNIGAVELKLNYDPLIATYTGVVLPAGGERF